MWVYPGGERAHEDEVREVFARLAAKAGVPPRRRHLHMGGVAGGLTVAIERLRASILVIGSVSRTGLARLLAGNKAERMLGRLACDALIVKPRKFAPR